MFPWLHPSLVHFAVALLFTGLLLDLLGLWRTNERLLFAGYWNTVLGAAAATGAVISGLLAEDSLGAHSRTGSAILEFHRIFGFAGCVTALTMATARVVMRGYILPRMRTVYLTVAFLGAGFLLTTGSLGGTLVYAYGLGLSPDAIRKAYEAQVAADPKPTPTPNPTIPGAVGGTPTNADGADETTGAGTDGGETIDAGPPPDAGTPKKPLKTAKKRVKPAATVNPG